MQKGVKLPTLTRRQFVRQFTCAWGAGMATWPSLLAAVTGPEGWNPSRPLLRLGRNLKVQPLLMYHLPTAKEATSWKSWGGIQTQAAVDGEIARINQELAPLGHQAELGVEILPTAQISTKDHARNLAGQDWDVTLLYACTGGGDLLQACLDLKPDNLVFVRHRSGPIYYWYEALSTRYLATEPPPDEGGQSSRPAKAHVDDVVVDDLGELAWRLRALRAVRNFLGSRILALGGPWGNTIQPSHTRRSSPAPIAPRRAGLMDSATNRPTSSPITSPTTGPRPKWRCRSGRS